MAGYRSTTMSPLPHLLLPHRYMWCIWDRKLKMMSLHHPFT
ncbi:hypothetical protein Ccrd_024040 [Cynara cardunculus var. scolymus]|uniref:Uncharacterized protein n=1 Tax=Cynara cardunculus var. scolymus TaxID=59895 RepID=A0A103DTP2_CYNCS|nr:hypothetical protein Ccrd_024040 [Cynara cardunculus var. scolymus]